MGRVRHRLPLYSCYVKTLAERALRYIAAAEAIELLESDKAIALIMESGILRTVKQDMMVFLIGLRDPGLRIILQLKAPERSDREDPCSIPARQVELYGMMQAGLSPEAEDAGRARKIRDKIEAWPTCGDNKAVRVGPRA